jgi:hypothetical protein
MSACRRVSDFNQLPIRYLPQKLRRQQVRLDFMLARQVLSLTLEMDALQRDWNATRINGNELVMFAEF